MEENYKELLDALRSADCVTAFQLAEANQKTFSSDEVRNYSSKISNYFWCEFHLGCSCCQSNVEIFERR